MIRFGILITVLFALMSCGPTGPKRASSQALDLRQDTRNSKPGIHISGYANVGVVKGF